ncbi:MFS transporter [Actinomycetospora atypica]|uniref:MFS transporter n=1 Tax=Actinomycetospora atypica TaxID=1290095 RepID=A0ABV9YMX1_9PSEU
MSTPHRHPSEGRADRRAWAGLAVLALVPALLSLDLTVLFLALPSLSTDLAPSSVELLWIGDVYPFMLAGFLVTTGSLGDRFGRRRLLLVGAAVFGLASIAAAYSAGPGMLIVARAALGVAGAMMLPNTLALVSTMFTDPDQRGLAIGVWISCFMGGTAVGPVVGGLLLSRFWWGAVFLVGVPLMLVLLVVGPFTVPEHRNVRAPTVDLPSIALSLVAILSLAHGLKDLARIGPTTVNVLILSAGLVLGLVFVRRQLGSPAPLLDLRLFGNRTFTVGVLFMVFGSVVMAGTLLLSSQYLQLVLGLPPAQAGLWSVPSAGGLALASLLAPVIARRFRAGHVMAVGVGVAMVGFVVLAQVADGGDLVRLVVGLILVQTGIGACGPLGTDLVLGAVPSENAGAATALSQTGLELGGALGIAGLGTVASVVYRAAMESSPFPAARDTLPGALGSAAGLDPRPAGELVAQARAAFTAGLHVVASVGTGITALLVVGAVVLSRRPPRPGTESVGADRPPADTSARHDRAGVHPRS